LRGEFALFKSLFKRLSTPKEWQGTTTPRVPKREEKLIKILLRRSAMVNTRLLPQALRVMPSVQANLLSLLSGGSSAQLRGECVHISECLFERGVLQLALPAGLRGPSVAAAAGVCMRVCESRHVDGRVIVLAVQALQPQGDQQERRVMPRPAVYLLSPPQQRLSLQA
jgi:hypothetical protein